MEEGKKPADGPEGATPLSRLRPRTPPAWPKITLDIGVPMGTSYTPGCAPWRLTPTNFSPFEPFCPCALNHSTPRARICGTLAKVSTLLMTVGFCHSPA